jgi:phytoene synthase
MLRRHSRSFSLAAGLLPPAVAADFKKLYAWCRTCDNVVDDARSRLEAKRHLQLIQEDVERIYAGELPRLPESHWLRELVIRYRFPQRWADDFLAGMAFDLDFSPMRSVAELEHYSYRVAGVVGLMLSRILGVSDARATAHAISLGIAMQLTNIARDIAEDWERGRFYLPLEWMSFQEVPREPLDEEQLRPAVEQLLRLADRHYEHGRRGLRYLPASARWSIRVAADIYQEIGNVIRRADYRVLKTRHYVTTAQKMSRLGVALAAEAGDQIRQFCGAAAASQPSTSVTGFSVMKRETLFLATFGLSLTCVMATVMFALVGMNPKLESYQQLPWVYASASAVLALGLGCWARWIDEPPLVAAASPGDSQDKAGDP